MALPVKKITAVTLVALVLAGCSSADDQAEKDHAFAHSQNELETAQRNATIQCRDRAQCDTVWTLTKRYIAQNSDTDIIRADADAIDTDVPTRSGRAVFSATRVVKDAGTTVTLYAQCRGMYGPDRSTGSDYDECVVKITKAQNGFRPFLNAHLAGQ